MDGYEIQLCGKHWNPRESLKPDWSDTDDPCWDFDNCYYRLKPAAKIRSWTADEVPLGAWMRNKSVQYDRWIIVHLQYSSRNREEWLDKYEHSTDGGKNWLPCGVVEEAK